MGTERAYEILTAMRDDLRAARRPCARTRWSSASSPRSPPGRATCGRPASSFEDGTRVEADAVIVAPGREGAAWLVDECKRLHIGMRTNPVDIGVRVEVPAVDHGAAHQRAVREQADLLHAELRRPRPHLLHEPLRRRQHRELRRRDHGQRPQLRRLQDRPHQLRPARLDRLHRAVRRPHRLRQVASPGSPTCSATTSSCSASATCSRGTARRWTASAAAPCSRR